jgi:hypothetical protein
MSNENIFYDENECDDNSIKSNDNTMNTINPKPTPDDIRLLVSSQISLSSHPIEKQNIHYRRILKSIEDYLRTYCNHNYVYDWIDVDVEQSKRVYYCEHCFQSR